MRHWVGPWKSFISSRKCTIKQSFTVWSDFTNSFFAQDFGGKPEKTEKTESNSLLSPGASPGVLAGSRPGFRDDLFQALHVSAVWLIGHPFQVYILSISAEHLFRLKAEALRIVRNQPEIDARAPIQHIMDLPPSCLKSFHSDWKNAARQMHFMDSLSQPTAIQGLSQFVQVVRKIRETGKKRIEEITYQD